MKIGRVSKVLALSAVLLLCGSAAAFAFTGTGAGIEADPYIITTPEELNQMRDDLAAQYRLGDNANIDLSAYLENNPLGWEPVGTTSAPFTGVLDGNRRTITGLRINRSASSNVGLFGVTAGATIKNLGAEISGVVSGLGYVGGLVGATVSPNGSITNCYVRGDVNGGGDYVGGLVGELGYCTITNCYTTGDVTGSSSFVGGLVGECYTHSGIQYCYSTSDVRGNSYAGGLAGRNYSPITNCYVMGNVNVNDANSYYAGMVVGSSAYNVTNNYRYENATLNGAARPENTPNGDHGGTADASQLRNRNTYASLLTIWQFGGPAWQWRGDSANGYPILRIGSETDPFTFSAPNPGTFTVTFNSNGGSAVTSPINVASGAPIPRPNDPTRSGYTFTGWYRYADATQPWNFATDKATGDMTLYAGWQSDTLPDTFTVTFYSNGGSAVTPVNARFGATINQPPAPTRAGYVFNGWYRDAGLTQLWNFATDTVTGDMTLYAGWWESTGNGRFPGGGNSGGSGSGGGGGCDAGAGIAGLLAAVLVVRLMRKAQHVLSVVPALALALVLTLPLASISTLISTSTAWGAPAADVEKLLQEGGDAHLAQDYQKAFSLWSQAAEMGSAKAQFNLGSLYYHGNGVPQDREQAAAWFRKAAEQGDKGSRDGLRYTYRRAADQGDVDAQFNLGAIYYKGEWVPKDNKQAAVWFRKAAEQGDADAQYYLGLLCYNGDGVPQDREQGVAWLRKAAAQGHAAAQDALSKIRQ